MIAGALNRLWHIACLPGARRFAAALADPGAVQRARLLALVRRHASSAFGRAHGFAAVRSVADFRARVPVQEWAQVAPWVERIRRGEQHVLGAEAVTRLLPTGGSGGGSKLIPWTAGLAGEFAAVLAPWIADLQRRHHAVLDGPAYWSVSPRIPELAGGALPVGFADDSAYLGGVCAALVRPLQAAPAALRGFANVEDFRYATVRCLLARPELRLISVWHPSFLGLLLDAARTHRARLLRDVAHGGLDLAVPPALLSTLAPWLGAQPRRAAALATADWDDARQLWPHLAVVSCWADGAAAVPAAALARRLGGAVLQAKGLLATEGAVSIPWGGRTVAAVTGAVLEFLAADGTPHWLDELDDGATYTVAMTTAGGLWRYRLGDLVRVEGFVQRTPCLRFLGRGDATVDLVGEKLDEAFVATCLAQAAPQAGFALLAPAPGGKTGYILYSDQCDADVAVRLEAALARNPHYALARSLGQLAPLRCALVGAGAEAIVLAHRAAGRVLGAVKPVVLDGDPEWGRRLAAVHVEGAPC